MAASTIAPGFVFTFRLANGSHGACRVLRPPGKEDIGRSGNLVVGTAFIGKPEDALADPSTRKPLKGARGQALYWIEGKPPASFALAGVMAALPKDADRRSMTSAPWEIFPNIVYEQWRTEHEPQALATERAQRQEEAARTEKERAASLAQRESIDVSRFVDFPKPRTEREPEEVVRGFIAAMNQWEKECTRIDRKEGTGSAFGIAAEPLRQIFAEFCTPRERKYGRSLSFSSPPEYDPKTERFLGSRRVKPRRTEVETQQASGFKHRVIYVLVKKAGCWLIDSKKQDGEPGIL